MVPDSWVIKDLGDIATISSGGTPNRSQSEYWGGDIPWVTTAEVNFGTITKTAQKITSLGMQCSSAKLFPKNTILMAMYGQGKTRGQVAKLGIEATTNQACAAIILKSGYSHEYLFQYLQSEYENIRGMSNGGGQNNLSAGLIKEIPVPVPPFAEQTKIAQILFTWDKAIATTERLLANSQQQKQALAQNLLTGRKRHRKFSGTWKSYRFGDLFERITKKNTEGNTNVVTISAQHGLIRQDEFFKKTVASATLEGYYLLNQGQFAYNKSYSNGYPMGAIKRLNRYEKGVVTTLYICFAVRDEANCCPVFFEQFFDAGLLNEGLAQIAHEGGRAHGLLNVKPADFFSLKVKVPSLEEQLKIAQVLSTADAEIGNLQAQLDKLKLEKKALMQQLLTGKRRVRLDDDEEDLAPIRRVG